MEPEQYRFQTGRPATGNYMIGDWSDYMEGDWNNQHFIADYYSYDQDIQIWSVSGSINVTTSSTSRFAGSFQFVGAGYRYTDTAEEINVTVQGNFDAVGGDVPLFKDALNK